MIPKTAVLTTVIAPGTVSTALYIAHRALPQMAEVATPENHHPSSQAAIISDRILRA